MKVKLCFILLLLSVINTKLKAQHDQFQFSQLNISNGLSHNWVTCIMKDSKGFMWFGTLSGLNKYDGYKFKAFKHAINDATTIDDDFIVSIAEGPDHKIWIQTRSGFNIYDPEKEIFIHNIAGYLQSIDIPDPKIIALKKDTQGNYWFIHAVYGLYRYNPVSKKTIHISHSLSNPNSMSTNNVSDVSLDSKGNIWLIFYSGEIECLEPGSYTVIYHTDIIQKTQAHSNSAFKLFIDDKDDMWAYVPTHPSGVYFLSADKTKFLHLDKGEGADKLKTNIISGIIQDEKGRIWIGTDHGGISILNKTDFSLKLLMNREDDSKSLGQNSILSIYKDDTDIIWIGTYKHGISYYHDNIIKFPLYKHFPSDPHSLPFNDINRFAEDKRGNLWLGTNGGGLIYFDRQSGTFKQYLHNPLNSNSLCNNVIVSMLIDHDQKLWIGTYYGGLDCFDGKKFTHFKHDEANPGSISDDRIWSIMEDSDHQLWFGTLAGGLNLFDRSKSTFTHFRPSKSNSIRSNYVAALLEDKRKALWIITSFGVDRFNKKTGRFTHYIHNPTNYNSLINNNTNSILEDSRGLLWISTREGISIFNPLSGIFQNITAADGLPHNTVLDLLEDDAHNIWASTSNGLSNIIVSGINKKLKFNFINYNETDGLQGSEFNLNSSFKTREGELIFGGANGFNIFEPSKIRSNSGIPNLAFTDFQLFNRSVKVGEKVDSHVVLPLAIDKLKTIELKHNENVFAIEFASLDYFNPNKVKLQYKMEGFNKSWITADNIVHKATYTNLDAGDYTFKVRAENSTSKYKELTLAVKVLPPFWQTHLAYIVYTLSFLAGLFFLRRRGIQKLRKQFEIEKEREEAKRMHELDLMKIKFFTNVSHEFRTPLSLILAPIDKVLEYTTEPETKIQLEFANRNARRLLNLVNQLLDFRKMEFQEGKLHLKEGEIISFIKDIAYSFTDIGAKKNVSFTFVTNVNEIDCEFDHDKIERILFNLLSNAFKFTLPGGLVNMQVDEVGMINGTTTQLQIKIADSGIGIPEEKILKIFEPFFQNDIPGSMVNQGSGIGLSITKDFVKLHNGSITIDSELGIGSCFTVVIPLKSTTTTPITSVIKTVHHQLSTSVDSKAIRNINKINKKPKVLIVEDNADFRFYIKDNLKQAFTIVEAADGKEGWQKTLASHPNLIVSDISMPEMDGIELCKKIKSDKRTSHLPVILLTALIGEEKQLKGLETGATDYMTKPFNFQILQSKIKNILEHQENMRKNYQKQVDVNPTPVILESPEEMFLQKLLGIIDENINNQNFSVEELSGEMFVSRYTLYKKVLALTGKTPNEFIRHIRLKRAGQLLENGYLTVSQVCHKVGFQSQKYFAKAFKAEFGVSPSNYTVTK